jgi:hypothetical protein
VGLKGFSTEELIGELESRGLYAVYPDQLQAKFKKQLKLAQKKMANVLKSMQSKRFVKKLTEDEKPQ